MSCDPEFDPECRSDMIRVVQVSPGVFYEYVRPPCVQLAYYDDAVQVNGRGTVNQMCANPALPVATRLCCISDLKRSSGSNWGTTVLGYANQYVEFDGELVTFDTNSAFCLSADDNITSTFSVCNGDQGSALNLQESPTGTTSYTYYHQPNYPSGNVWQWTKGQCDLQMKVRPDGYVAIVHTPAYINNIHGGVTTYVDAEKTFDYFSVPWERDVALDEFYPSAKNGCGGGSCQYRESDNTCLCNITLVEAAAFSANSTPSREDILKECFVGGFNPSILDGYELLGNNGASGSSLVESYGIAAEGISSTGTIFKLTDDNGEIIYLKNFKSTIRWGASQSGDDLRQVTRTLRNVPHFMDLATPELRDVHYEIDAFLRSLIRYESTAPNVCTLLIKHLGGNSNPSPGYVRDVVTAFRQGTFSAGGVAFGTGDYGDLAATAAAILLHREATNSVLDADPTHGSQREPISKVLKYMRSLEYVRAPQDKMIYPILHDMDKKVGQEVYSAPDQFGFFDSNYAPPGTFASSGLTSPESQLQSISWLTGLINGLYELSSRGLDGSRFGFGKNNLLQNNDPVGFLSFQSWAHTSTPSSAPSISAMPTTSAAPSRPLVNLARMPGVSAAQSSNFKCGYTPGYPIAYPDDNGCNKDAYLDFANKALGYTYGAQLAIDGIKNDTAPITHTQSIFPEFPWWRVDFGPLSLSEILTVKIYNRVDCCQGRLRNFTVDVLDEYENVVSSIHYPGNSQNKPRPIVLDFSDTAPQGRFVRLSLGVADILRELCIT